MSERGYEESGRSDESAFVRRHANFGAILEQNAKRLRINERVVLRASSAQPEVLDRVRIRRFLFGTMSFVKTVKAALPVVETDFAGRICA